MIALFLLAPWTAECSWGGFTAIEFPFVVAILAPMYGGAAVLIREAARRTGGGWPAIVLLAAAFGFVQAGLVDQSLLNPGFLADTEFADSAVASRSTLIGGLGISVEQVLDYVGNHIALSICAPIAIVESSVTPQRRQRPWLGPPGLALIAALYLGGSLLIFGDTAMGDQFTPSTAQLTVVIALVAVLVGAAFVRWVRPAAVRSGAGPAAHPLWVGALVGGAPVPSWFLSGWALVTVRLACVVLVVIVVVAWSRRPGWGQAHVLAAWGGGLVVAAGTAYLVPTYAPSSPQAALVGDIAISVVTATLLATAALRLRRSSPTSPDLPQRPVSTGVVDEDRYLDPVVEVELGHDAGHERLDGGGAHP